jgi:hypothetical protein
MLGDFRAKQSPDKTNWLLWWRLGPSELDDQVANYDTMGWFESGRKLSTALLLIYVGLTVLAGTMRSVAIYDAVTLAIFAAFIYRGHRWAIIAAMVLWTLDRVLVAISGNGDVYPVIIRVIGALLWWAIYMHAFYLAFRVEQRRRKAAPVLNQAETTLTDQVNG